LVESLTNAFLDSEGDLTEVTRALVTAPQAWAPETKKLRTPVEFVVAAARLTGKPVDPLAIAGPLQALGQPLWNPSGPNGFPDRNEYWATPAGMKGRLDVAAHLGEAAATADRLDLMAEAFGTAVSDATREAVGRAESRQQAVAILLMSPEFQRR
jgi:uncharacterized protein (DUF1800 family)